MRLSRNAAIAVFCVASAVSALAKDTYVVQGRAVGASLGGGATLLWSTDAFFLNRGSKDETVRLLGVSNGGSGVATPDTILIPPGRSASLVRMNVIPRPVSPSALWVVKLDVPSDVDAESVLFIGSFTDTGTLAPPFESPYRFGKLRLPVFTTFTPAGTAQYHLATYLGAPEDIPSRLNVAVYNAGSTAATATIEVRQHCDDSVVASKVVSIAPDTLIQVGGFTAAERQCPFGLPLTLGGPIGSVYTVVTVDQPSFTFVSNLANREIPTTSISITSP